VCGGGRGVWRWQRCVAVAEVCGGGSPEGRCWAEAGGQSARAPAAAPSASSLVGTCGKPLLPSPRLRSLPTTLPLLDFSGQGGLNWGGFPGCWRCQGGAWPRRWAAALAPGPHRGVPVGGSPSRGHPSPHLLAIPALLGGDLANIQRSQTCIFILFYCSSKKMRAWGEEIITLALNTPGGGGEGRPRYFCLCYLPRTAGASSGTRLGNGAPMGAAALGTVVCSGS